MAVPIGHSLYRSGHSLYNHLTRDEKTKYNSYQYKLASASRRSNKKKHPLPLLLQQNTYSRGKMCDNKKITHPTHIHTDILYQLAMSFCKLERQMEALEMVLSITRTTTHTRRYYGLKGKKYTKINKLQIGINILL